MSSAVTMRGFGFNVIDSLSGTLPVMLINAVNGGYLRPDAFQNHDSHDGEARTWTQDLEKEGKPIKDARGHLWYITPYIFNNELQKTLYFVESAASGEDPSKRRRLTVNPSNPSSGIRVGCMSEEAWKQTWSTVSGLQSQEYYQQFIVTLTCCGGLTFVPVVDLCLILGNLGYTVTVGECFRPIPNLSCDPHGFLGSTYYPRPDPSPLKRIPTQK